jgi:hypothetical protein
VRRGFVLSRIFKPTLPFKHLILYSIALLGDFVNHYVGIVTKIKKCKKFRNRRDFLTPSPSLL